MNYHRKEIEQFVRDFLKGNNKHLHDVIDNYRHLLSQINIQQMAITQETFNSSFKSISNILFNTRPADENYIIPLLGFALQMHEYHVIYCSAWYNDDMIINTVADILAGINFQPKELNAKPTYCIIL